jgi:Fungalysin metallopeptidase (M36)
MAPSGCVYIWSPQNRDELAGRVTKTIQPLVRLRPREGGPWLRGEYVNVRNGGLIATRDEDGVTRTSQLGDAEPDSGGNFIFDPGRGGERIDKFPMPTSRVTKSHVEASHFGEVNTYFHVDRIAHYVNGLLRDLDASLLPVVEVVVNAHHAVAEIGEVPHGATRGEVGSPFQGGHYRLPSWRYDIPEYEPISPRGEIHLGPGRALLKQGALVDATGAPYRHNASHNAGIIYHEYGHHINRHTADFRANRFRPELKQSNRKIPMDEGTSDYWAAALLETPHIWAWHRRHDGAEVHPRSLVSKKTMADFDSGPDADPHENGTIWAAALWEFRERLRGTAPDGARNADLILLKALTLMGHVLGPGNRARIQGMCRARERFSTGLDLILIADEILDSGRHREDVLRTFSARGIEPSTDKPWILGDDANSSASPSDMPPRNQIKQTR